MNRVIANVAGQTPAESRLASTNGFTLLELLVSLAIFTVIGLATVKHIQQIQNTKTMAFKDLDLYSDARSAISLLRTDLGQAFHVLYDDLGDESRQAVLQNQPVAHTIFDGRKSEIIFTSLSHRTYYRGRRETDQTEISYFLQRKDKSKFPSLMKRESEIIDGNLFEGGAIYTLVDGVSSLEFQYWDEKANRWVQDWNSDGGAYRDQFPRSVKVKMEVSRDGQNKLSAETQIKLTFPNNDQFLVQF